MARQATSVPSHEPTLHVCTTQDAQRVALRQLAICWGILKLGAAPSPVTVVQQMQF